MKSLIQFSLRNKFAIWLLTIIVTVVGLYSGLTMKQETIPNINVPYLSVTAVYPGAAPEGVVQDITKPLETRLHNVDGVKTITSTSMENAASLFIEFDYGTNLDNATAAVREALNDVALPEDAQKPQITRFSLNSMPVISLSMSQEGDDLEALTRTVENSVIPELEDIEGVASVQASGQYVKEVQLNFDEAKMQQLGLTEETVQGIVQASALRIPLGLFDMEKAQKAVVVDGNVTTVDDLKNLAIPVTGGAGAAGAGAQGATGAAQGGMAAMPTGLPTVKLGDIAKIEVIGKAESISRTNGEESIGIQIVKDNDANTVDVTNLVKDKIKELEKEYGNIHMTVMLDQGKPITASVHTMLSKALFGALFAILIILLFLRNIRSTIISIISIPLSLLIAILILNQMDITLNMMTLGALTVAIGRVVDDSIVVIENIYRRLSLTGEKLKGGKLIIEATREMFIPIMSSTIVTIAVFLPLAFVSGMVGELFKPFAYTMVFALLASLLVAVTLVPALAHTLFRKSLGKKHDHDSKPKGMARGYQRVLNWTLSHKLITFGLAILLLVGSVGLYPLVGVSFLSDDQQEKYVMVTYSPEPGDRMEDVKEKMAKAESFILGQKDIESIQYSVGGGGPLSGMGSSNSALFYVMYDEDTKNFSQVKEDLLTGLEEQVPEGEWGDMSALMTGGLGGSTLSVNVFGDDLETIKPVSEQILTWVQEDTKNFEEGETSLSTAYDQYTLVADQQKLSSLGLTPGQLVMALSPARERPVLTEVKVDGKTYKVYIETEKNTYSSIQDIENEMLTSPLGLQVPIKDIAKVEEGTSPNSIMRIDGKMVVEVSANILGNDVQKASNSIQDKIDGMDLPEGVTVKFGGVTEQINETFGQLFLAMAAAVAIVYFVLVVTFGGGLAPFAILFSLPFIIIGAMVGLLIGGQPLDVSALMGILMLIGIVVTNAIVLIDRVIHKEREGLSTREALLEAGATRLRPILMTAIATIGALLPLVMGWEQSSGMISKGLGITVIGGLISSTLLTLVIVPIVYEFLAKFRRRDLQAHDAEF